MQNHRRFFVESLENRLLLAADIAYQNPLLYQDVNFDQEISPVDALQVINHLNVAETISGEAPVGGFLDVSGDGHASAIDALQIINGLNGVGTTNHAIFEQIENLTAEVELMADVLPEDLDLLGQNLLARVQEQSAELVAIHAELEEFLNIPRKNELALTERGERFAKRADDLATHFIKEFNKLNDDPESDNLLERDLNDLGLHKRFKAKFDEVRRQERREQLRERISGRLGDQVPGEGLRELVTAAREDGEVTSEERIEIRERLTEGLAERGRDGSNIDPERQERREQLRERISGRLLG